MASCSALQLQSIEISQLLKALMCLSGEHGPHLARSVEKHVRWFWRFIMCPLLFGLIGTLMNFRVLKAGTIPKSVAIIFAGASFLKPFISLNSFS